MPPSRCPSSRGLLLHAMILAMILLDVLLASHDVSHTEPAVSLSRYSALLLVNKNLPNDLDLWPTTLNYNPSLAKVKVNSHSKIEVIGQMVRLWECWHTHTQTAPILLPRPLTRKVKNVMCTTWSVHGYTTKVYMYSSTLWTFMCGMYLVNHFNTYFMCPCVCYLSLWPSKDG